MNERTAREIALVRAIETTDREQRLLKPDDRMHANRSARELSQWQAADNGHAAPAELFLQKRSQLILDRLCDRHPALTVVRRPGHWHVWAGIGICVAALLVGAFAERIVNPQRVDLLSGALLLIVGWNLLLYLALLLWPLIARMRRGDGRTAPASAVPALARWLVRSPERAGARIEGELGTAVLAFGRDWSRASAGLSAARVARIMHLAAALFAIGAIGSLYMRGIVSEYRVGWESTFLDANQVHGLLSVVFWPVVKLAGMQPFTVEQVAALQFSQPPHPESGARWVHSYAALLGLVVVLPRLALAGLAGWRERRLVQSFGPDLGEPYFRRLLSAIGKSGGSGATLRVLPYSFSVDEARDQGLQAVAAQLLGDDARIMLRPSTGYGADPRETLAPANPGEPAATAPALTLVLFNLAATPEKENHGEFLDHVVANVPRRVAVLIDESALVERLGSQTSAVDRLAERRGLWRNFCEMHGLSVAFVDLLSPSLAAIEHDLGPRVAAALT